jgi:hypothetical protein
MKKIFTLLFTVGMFTLAQAQPGSRDNRQTDQRNNQQTDQRDFNNGYDKGNDVVVNNQTYDKGDYRYDNDRFSFERKRDMEIARINREYDYKIQRVRNSFFTGRFEKERQIRFLQEQRQREIRIVYIKFPDKRRYDNDHSNHHY